MPIRRHGAGYEARVQHAGRRFSRTFKTRADAQEWERRFRTRVADHRVGRVPSYSLEEAFTRWIDGDLSLLKSRDSVISKIRTMLPHIQGRMLDEIPAVAEAVKAAGLKERLKPATINRRLAALRRVAKLAWRSWGWLDQDLGAKISLLPGEKQRHVYLSAAQVQRWIEEVGGKEGEFIRWAALTGLRKGELLSLTPQSFEGRTIVLPDTKNGRPRIVPLPPELNPKKFPFGLNESNTDKALTEARRRAGLDHARVHDLRHTFASWVLADGHSAVTVRDLLGHSSLAVTSRYTHLARKDLQNAVKGLSIAGKPRKRKAG